MQVIPDKLAAAVLIPAFSLTLSACAVAAYPQFHQFAGIVDTPDATKRQAELIYYLLAGEFALRNNDFAAAFEHYRNAAHRTSDADVLESAFRLGLTSRDYASALVFGEKWLAQDPDDLEIRQLLAVAYVMDNRFEKAMLLLQGVIGRDGVDEGRILTTLSATLMSEMPDEAESLMREMAERFAGSAQAQYVYALFLLNTGDYRGGAEFARKASRIDPDFANAYLLHGWALISGGEVDHGLAIASQAVGVAPGDVAVRGNYARLLVEQEKGQEALEQFRVVYEQSPHNPDVVQAIGILSMQQGDFAVAADFFDRLGTFPGRYTEAVYYQGRVAEERGELHQALVAYQMIPQGDFFKQAQISIAGVYRKLGDPGKSVEQLERARELAANAQEQVEFYLEQGRILSEYTRYAEVIDLYTRAIKEHGALASLLYARGFAAAELGLMGRFEADMLRILQDDPANADVLNALGYLFADRNIRLDEARSYILRAHQIDPDDPAILDSLGWVEFRLNNIATAEMFIRKAASKLRHPDVLGHLAEILCFQQRMTEAQALLADAIEEFPDNAYLQGLREICPR